MQKVVYFVGILCIMWKTVQVIHTTTICIQKGTDNYEKFEINRKNTFILVFYDNSSYYFADYDTIVYFISSEELWASML